MPDEADVRLAALRASVTRLRGLVTGLDDTALERPAYPTEWSIDGVLSHLGSAAEIYQRRLDDGLRGESTPDDYAPTVWDTWNAKPPRDRADDALVADQALVERLESLTADERSQFHTTMGPLDIDFPMLLAFRLSEHAMHTWDVEVALDPAATVAPEATELLIDNLELIARFTAKPTGTSRTLVVRTTGPQRTFTITLAPDGVSFTPGESDQPPDLTMPAEAFARLVYGRLDPNHTPAMEGDTSVLDELRKVYPGP